MQMLKFPKVERDGPEVWRLGAVIAVAPMIATETFQMMSGVILFAGAYRDMIPHF